MIYPLVGEIVGEPPASAGADGPRGLKSAARFRSFFLRSYLALQRHMVMSHRARRRANDEG